MHQRSVRPGRLTRLTAALLLASAAACTSREPPASPPPDQERGRPALSAATTPPSASGPEVVARERTRAADGARPVLIVFTGDFCTPCRVMKPWIDEVARDQPGIAVARVNVDRPDNERLVTFFQVDSVPTLVFAEADGAIVARREGLMSRAELQRALRERAWTE